MINIARIFLMTTIASCAVCCKESTAIDVTTPPQPPPPPASASKEQPPPARNDPPPVAPVAAAPSPKGEDGPVDAGERIPRIASIVCFVPRYLIWKELNRRVPGMTEFEWNSAGAALAIFGCPESTGTPTIRTGFGFGFVVTREP
jgi:hypothetical protein